MFNSCKVVEDPQSILGINMLFLLICVKAMSRHDIESYIPQWIANWLLISGINKAKIPGADFSGIIYKIGDEVFGLNLSIIGNGCLSQYIKLSENMPNMIHKPTNLSHIEAAAIPLAFLTAYTTLHDWGSFIVDNPKILILGASGDVGHIACQIVRAMNAYIVGICSTQNIEFVQEMSTNEIFLKSNQSIYLTIVGNKTSRNILGGIISYLFASRMILRSLKSIIGLGPRYYYINLSSKKENIDQILYMFNKGIIKPVIDSIFKFSNHVKQAYERLDTSRVKGKVVTDFDK
ncbi:unnamed protein product [Rotaria sordida]|uniref:Enoyl reductase (ER) domain-containing protein n=1 Tax=Rotaria sordida TaxID=392033 RepID=A0A819IN27_9BILA|nr:unnamed protein product [Rotaria sordida]CAF1365597.1 unnamed protein product [Rotaria sordida]CAF3917195.1 unnamed protein product [Rotaria sordida]CAF3977095.1 unnamed protein product [Rotaria sordida]